MFIFLWTLSSLLVFVVSDKGCQGVEIINREEWGARKPIHFIRKMKVPLNHVIIMHTATPFCRTKAHCARYVRAMQDYHVDEKAWFDIGYNFLVGGDGRVYGGRGWRNRGAHSVKSNTNSLAIAFIGNYNNYPPTEAMISATQNLIDCGVNKGYLTPIREIHGHQDVSCTKSPGKHLYAIIVNWNNFKGGKLPRYYCKRRGKK